MSRREPMNQVRWEDVDISGTLFSELSRVYPGPNRACGISVFKLHKNHEYMIHCPLLQSPPSRLTATTMLDAKQEALDIVRILLHNILSDL